MMMKLKTRLSKHNNNLPKTERVRIVAGACGSCRSAQTRVYKTQGIVRYCVCDGCGETWQKSGPLANPLIDLAIEAVELFGNAEIVKTEDAREVVIVDVRAATDLANRFTAVLP